MTAAKVIEEIQNLPREEQSLVVQFAFELARNRQLSGAEIAVLAQKMVNTTDPSEKARLRAELTRGFYGDKSPTFSGCQLLKFIKPDRRAHVVE